MGRFLLLILLLVSSLNAFCVEKIEIGKNLNSEIIGKKTYILTDNENKLTISDVQSSDKFELLNKDIATLQSSSVSYWMRFTLSSNDYNGNLIAEFVQPFIDEITFYYPEDATYRGVENGLKYPFFQRDNTQSTNFAYDLHIEKGQEKTYYVKVRIKQQSVVPIRLMSPATFYSNALNLNIWFGIYCGIILVMFLYNIFVYISTRDKSYVYYVIHTLVVGITQATLTGFTYKYLWPNAPGFADYSFFLPTCLVSIVGIEFLIIFLRIKIHARRMFWVLKGFQAIYVVFIITSFLGLNEMTYVAMLPTQGTIAFIILGISIYLYRKGLSEAKYYLIGWSSLMAAIVIYALKDAGVMPFNNFTSYSLLFGSAAEVTLLSFALADRINIYKKEKEESQTQALAALEENARIIREQNVILETKVNERTLELRKSNDDLSKAMKELKDAEANLVESEKMASLGQLTAGIAHEINNPINFVTSNVKPLKRDVEMIIELLSNIEEISFSEGDNIEEKKAKVEELKQELDYDYLKDEIQYLLKGIMEGSNRTAEIVKGLRVFSRLDEDDLKKADINECLDSTMIIVNNQLDKIQVNTDFGNLPAVECYPGKLNQVFLNIITNGLQAIRAKFGEEAGGTFSIKTSHDENDVFISLKDNGIGMDEDTMKKVFEPFFTTKEVGEGTGLGMSIAYNTINKHNGKIDINSDKGEGTEFILTIPIVHKQINTQEVG
ncbi:MAG: sensor histidine kinase [Chitinophagaceae bacterium]|nr:sensor histidine kinase [Chitinophagaceae bacterium]